LVVSEHRHHLSQIFLPTSSTKFPSQNHSAKCPGLHKIPAEYISCPRSRKTLGRDILNKILRPFWKDHSKKFQKKTFSPLLFPDLVLFVRRSLHQRTLYFTLYSFRLIELKLTNIWLISNLVSVFKVSGHIWQYSFIMQYIFRKKC